MHTARLFLPEQPSLLMIKLCISYLLLFSNMIFSMHTKKALVSEWTLFYTFSIKVWLGRMTQTKMWFVEFRSAILHGWKVEEQE